MSDRALEITAAAGPAWIQDGGRPGHMHDGVPPGGALVPELLAAANRAVGNRWDAPAIERFAAITLTALGGRLALAADGRRYELNDGETLELGHPQPARVGYVAVAGGFDAPEILGGSGLLLVAGFGGGVGRPLRRGDALPIASAADASAEAHAPGAPPLDLSRAIRVIPGPDLADFAPDALEQLVSTEWRMSPASDRTGFRLDGPLLARRTADAGISMPMAQGAIEVPAGGAPIVLGPDHPTTGGYPVLATVIRADQGALAVRRPGAPVRFAATTAAEAREAWRRHAARFFA